MIFMDMPWKTLKNSKTCSKARLIPGLSPNCP